MEFDVYRNWPVRDIRWCVACETNEANGPGADLCARCQVLDEELEALWQS